MNINWNNVFSWLRSASASVAGVAGAIYVGAPAGSKMQSYAGTTALIAGSIAGLGQGAKEVTSPTSYPQKPIVTPPEAPKV